MNNDPAEKAAVAAHLQHYRDLIDDVGPGFEATGWRRKDFQSERFRVFMQMQDFEGRVILDAGAGRADLAAHLLDSGIQFERFIAVEAMPEMAELIESRAMPGVEVACYDFATAGDAFSRFDGVDVTLFSGSLNTMPFESARGVLQRAWESAGEGILFNFLSDRCPPELLKKDSGPANRFDTLALIDWATSETSLVRFRQDYLGGHDATIAMLRDTDE